MKWVAIGLLLLIEWALAPADAFPLAPAGLDSTDGGDSSQAAQGSQRDWLIVSGQFDHISPAIGGVGGSLDWIHSADRGRSYTAGVASFSIGDSHWTFGRVGVAFRPQERTFINADANLGAGRTGASEFSYQLVRAGLIYKATRSLGLNFGDRYIHIAGTRGNLFEAGALVVPAHRLTVEISYDFSAGGNLNTDFLLSRLNWKTRRLRYFAGGAVGHSSPETLNLVIASPPANRSLREAFAGFTVPFFRSELSVTADFLNLGTLRRRTLTLSFRFPLGKPL